MKNNKLTSTLRLTLMLSVLFVAGCSEIKQTENNQPTENKFDCIDDAVKYAESIGRAGRKEGQMQFSLAELWATRNCECDPLNYSNFICKN